MSHSKKLNVFVLVVVNLCGWIGEKVSGFCIFTFTTTSTGEKK